MIFKQIDVTNNKYTVLKRLASYCEKHNTNEFNTESFINEMYPGHSFNEFLSAFGALYDEDLIYLLEDQGVAGINPSAFNYLQNQYLKRREKIIDNVWDISKLVLAALAGALMAKFIK